jgi:DNA uptake protein ComE-like DNA-binding protein
VEQQGRQAAELRERERALAKERRTMDAAHERERRAAERAVEREREDHSERLGRWIERDGQAGPTPPSSALDVAGQESGMQQVNLNEADADELDDVEGLRGHGLEIVRYREDRGRFESLRQLDEVPGLSGKIDEATSAALTV